MLVCVCSPRDFKKADLRLATCPKNLLETHPSRKPTRNPTTQNNGKRFPRAESLPAPSAWLQVTCTYIYIHVYTYICIYTGSNLVQLGATRAHQATDADQPMQVSRENLVLNCFRGSRTRTLSRARVFVCA